MRPTIAGAQNNLGVILLMEGRAADAAARFERAIQSDPLRSPEPYFNLARAAEQLPWHEQRARALLQHAMVLQPGIERIENTLLWKLRERKPQGVTFKAELRVMWPYGYPVPDSPEGY